MRRSNRINSMKKESSQEEQKTKDDDKVNKKKTSTKKRKIPAIIKEEEKVVSPEKVKKVIVKGKVPVDSECHSMINKGHVYHETSECIYSATLNQTNLQFNNNKYYILQVLEDDNTKAYHVWLRWGRVGKVGQNKLESFGSNLNKAKEVFCKKFLDKTKNDWSHRDAFTKYPGKYDLVELDFDVSDSKKEEIKKEDEDEEKVMCKLEPDVQTLITLICDVKMMEKNVREMKFDAKRSPLGKLTKAQIMGGFKALKEIESLMKKDIVTGPKILAACNDFYTRIPHDFGMKVPPLINDWKMMKCKTELLEALEDIEIAMNIIGQKTNKEHPLDTNYRGLNCEIEALESTLPEYEMISNYLFDSHGSTHNMYKMELMTVFKVHKDCETKQFLDVGNKMLLWHGSRTSNWMGILSQSLRIAPPEAPVTGYMFGKGVYFADCSTKSANYAYPSRASNVGLIVLCEVSLGQCHELLHASSDAASLPKDKHSVKGLGRIMPDPQKHLTIDGDCIVPLGKPVESTSSGAKGHTLIYNEYVVYDTRQIKMRYLLQVKFLF